MASSKPEEVNRSTVDQNPWLTSGDIWAAAPQGVVDAVRAALGCSDRAAYLRLPEHADTFWNDVEAWGERVR